MDHSSCVPGWTRDVYFVSRVSPIINVQGPFFSVLGLGPRLLCKIRVPVLGPSVRVPVLGPGSHLYRLGPGSWVTPLGFRVSGPGSHPLDGSPVPPKVPGLGSYFSNMLLLKAKNFFHWNVSIVSRSYEIVLHALFVCDHYFFQYGFIQVCIFYRFFWKTSILPFGTFCIFCLFVEIDVIFQNFITFA